MYMEVMKHGITMPPPQNANIVRVDAAKKEGHDPTVAEQMGSDFIRIYTGVDRNGKGCCTQVTGDHNLGHGLKTTTPIEEYVQGCVDRSVAQFYMEDPAHDGADRAEM